MAERTQRNNIMLAFITLVAVVLIVSIIGFITFRKGTEIIQGQAEANEYRVSSKVPGRILKIFVDEGDAVKAGDTLAILEAPDVMAKLSQAEALEQAAQALNEKPNVAPVPNNCKPPTKCGKKPKQAWKSPKIIPTGKPPVRRRSNVGTKAR